ncbi:MAG: PH domain-containing protein, partial [Muribaculaceae bacterium]|nr:PH domain-containing protein [Muribaculaceae bacterium]
MTYRSKVDWWIPVVVIFSVACCFVGPMFDGDYLWGIILGIAVLVIEILIFTSVKYKIEGNRLGIRSFYRWTWYPIDKISEVKRHRSVLSAPALSFDRLAIK